MDIADFMKEYPEQGEKYFGAKLYRFQEFSEFRQGKEEKIPPRGVGFKHQQYGVRFMENYDRKFIIHEPGTGKTCWMAGVAEFFKHQNQKDPRDPSRIKGAIVITGSETLTDNFKQQLINQCTKEGEYYDEDKFAGNTERGIKNQLTRAVKKWYKFMTFTDLANMVKREKLGKADIQNPQAGIIIREFLRNKIIVIDEAHDLVTLDYRHSLNSFYEQFFIALHMAEHSKIVLATATPMTNSPLDFIPLMNLLLPMTNQMPNLTEDEFVNMPDSLFGKYTRGYLSYVSSREIPVKRNYVGEQDEGRYIKYYPVIMSDFQAKAYKSTLKSTNNGFYLDTRQSASFVFPDGSYGNDGFDKYVMKSDKRYIATPEFRRWLKDPEKLQEMSAKASEMIEICQDSQYNPRSKSAEKLKQGIVFVYFSSFHHGSGAIVYGLAMEENGYEYYTGDTPMFLKSGKSRLNASPRYSILSGETTQTQFRNILNAISSPANKYGQYLQVVIGTVAARTGISLANVVKVIKVDSSWNFSNDKQATNRAFRATSHEERMKDLKEGEKFEVDIYNLASFIEVPNDDSDDENVEVEPTFDVNMYLASEDKDKKNAMIMRKIRIFASDCMQNKARNILSSELDGTPECDYMPCYYVCDGENKNYEGVSSSKIAFYSEEESRKLIPKILKYASEHGGFTDRDICNHLNVNPEILFNSLGIIIREKIAFVDRYGRKSMISMTKDGIFVSSSEKYRYTEDGSAVFYEKYFTSMVESNGDTFASFVRKQNIESIDFESIPIDSIKSLSPVQLISLVEESLMRFSKGNASDRDYDIIRLFPVEIYSGPMPSVLISKLRTLISNRFKGKGRPPKNKVVSSITDVMKNGEEIKNLLKKREGYVIVHSLYDLIEANTKTFGKDKKKTSTVRVLRNTGWDNGDNAEVLAYTEIFNELIEKDLEKYERYSIYGRYDGDIFKIVDKGSESHKSAFDKRNRNTGKACKNWTKKDLLSLIERLDIDVPKKTTIPSMCRAIEEYMEKNDLIYRR